jgi:phenylacetate-CoA ligase
MNSIYETNSFLIAFLGASLFSRLKLHEHFTRAQLKSLQERRLQALITHAARNVPYYRELFRRMGIHPEEIRTVEDLKKLPILTRRDVREHFEALHEERQKRVPGRSLLSVQTTGSTGHPLTISLADSEFIQGLTFITYGFLRSGAKMTDSFAQIVVPSPHRGSFLFERMGLLRQHYIDLRQGVERTISQLNELQPRVIYSYPSFLALMAKDNLQSHPLEYPVRLVITHGEMLSDRCRALLSRAFSCPVRDSYGAAEVFRIAYECQFRRLHIIPDSAVVEVDESTLDSNGAADIVVTPLYLKTMPLIRYKLGDRVILSEDPCPCGSDFTTIRKIVGRSDDDLTLPGGKRISARAINLLENVPGIVEYQIIQKSRERFEVHVKTGTEYGPDSRRQIEQTIARGCAPEAVQVDIRIVEAVRRASNGKLNAVISEVDR